MLRLPIPLHTYKKIAFHLYFATSLSLLLYPETLSQTLPFLTTLYLDISSGLYRTHTVQDFSRSRTVRNISFGICENRTRALVSDSHPYAPFYQYPINYGYKEPQRERNYPYAFFSKFCSAYRSRPELTFNSINSSPYY